MSDFKTDKWVYVEPFGVIYDENTNKVIATVHGAGTGSCFCLTPEGQANARLMAAAQKLYNLVLEELIPTSDYGGIISFEREARIRKVLDYIDGENLNRMPDFTEERWTYDEHTGCVHCNGMLIADVAGAGGENYSYERGKVNARLIAAAPKMCDLLEDFILECACASCTCEDREKTRNEAQNLLARVYGSDDGHE